MKYDGPSSEERKKAVYIKYKIQHMFSSSSEEWNLYQHYQAYIFQINDQVYIRVESLYLCAF